MVVFGEKWLYSGKVVLIGKNGCIPPKLLYSGRVVVFGQNVCFPGKRYYSGKSCCIWAKVVVFGQSFCNRSKVVVLRQKLLTLWKENLNEQ